MYRFFKLVAFAALLVATGCGGDSTPSVNQTTGDQCEDGAERETACGPNDEGVLTETCSDGEWSVSEECTAAAECTDDETRESPTVCGLNDEGFIIENCESGVWVATNDCTGADVCTNGESQNSTTVCGANDEGLLVENCTDGQWVVSDTCSMMDACANGETRDSATTCGLNNEGFLAEECVDGEWVESTVCSGTDVCMNGDLRNSTTVCGLNDEGFLADECTNGEWITSNICSGTDVCTNGDQQDSTTVCGLNDEGFLVDDCTNGAWVTSNACSGTDVCTNGDTQNSTTVCGLNNEGVLVDDCTNGAWVTSNVCTGTDVCTNGNSQESTTACGLNNEGFFLEDCTNGSWVISNQCTGADVCVNGTTEDLGTVCGFNSDGVESRTCSNGQWDTPVCNILDQPAVCLSASCNITTSQLGRNLTTSFVNLNGTGTNAAVVSPGQNVSFAINGGWVDTNTSCPSCFTQFYARMDGVFNECLGSSTGDLNFNESTSFTAPTTPGVYHINLTSSWEFSCSSSTSAPSTLTSNTVATLIVRNPSTGFSRLGRNFSITGNNVDGTGNDWAVRPASASTTYAITGSVVDTNTSCPNCVTQFYTRVSNVMSLCLGSSTDTFSVNASNSFNAPATPGIYFINGEAGWDFSCNASLSSSDDITDATTGYLIVHP